MRLSYRRGRPPANRTPVGAATAPESTQAHPGTPGGPAGCVIRSAAGHLNSTLDTFTVFLPSFSLTVPVTVPSLASWQIGLWYFLWPSALK